MSLPAFAVRRPIATVMVLLAGVMLGVVSLPRLEVTLLPELRSAHLTVWIPYPNAGVLEIEEGVARPVEEALVGAPGVRDVRSVIIPGGTTCTVELQPGADPDVVALAVRERLDAVRWQLPRGVERLVLLGGAGVGTPDLVLALASDDLEGAARWAEHVLGKRLEQIEGVARAEVVGAPRPEVTVRPDPDALASAGVGSADLARAIGDANVQSSGGTLRQRGVRYALRMESALQDAAQVADVVVERTEARPIRVRDVAEVTDGFAPPTGWTRLDGRPAVGVRIYRESGENLVVMADRVHAMLADLKTEYPAFDVAVISDPSPFVRQALTGVTQAVWMGGLLAFLILVAFLRELRSPLYLVIALPVSLLITLIFFDLADVSLNLMSLGGLALGVGMLVDNSIICLENIQRLRARGVSAPLAAARGAEQVSLPILASTLTSCAVFVPLAFVPGTIGSLFRDQAVAVAASLGVSLIVALTLLPLLAGRLAPGAVAEPVRPAYRTYHRLLERWIAAPRRHLLLTALLLAASVWVLAERPREILPELATDQVHLGLRLPPGTDVAATDLAVRELESWCERPEVGRVLASVGAVGGVDPTDPNQEQNRAGLRIKLSDTGVHRRDALIEELRRAFADRGDWTLEILADRPELAALMPRGKAALTAEILGPDPERAGQLAQTLSTAAAAALPADAGLHLSSAETEPRYALTPHEDVWWRHGLAESDVFDAVEAHTSGLEATRIRRFQEEIPVVLRAETEASPHEADIVVAGMRYPVRALFDVRQEQSPARVVREHQTRISAIRWDGPLRGVDVVRDAILDAERANPLPAGYRLTWGGTYTELQETIAAMLRAFLLSSALVLLILAGQFESLRLPLLIFAAVPLSLVGVAAALWLTGSTWNAFSGIGLVVLVGIVVNDSILKVDLLRKLRADGVPVIEAVRTASRRRYRPILMTTLTTSLALLPLFVGAGSKYLAPLAATVIGGLLSATVLTLLVIPALFVIVSGRDPQATESA